MCQGTTPFGPWPFRRGEFVGGFRFKFQYAQSLLYKKSKVFCIHKPDEEIGVFGSFLRSCRTTFLADLD